MDGFMPGDLSHVLERISQITSRFDSVAVPQAGNVPGAATSRDFQAAMDKVQGLTPAITKAAQANGLDPRLVQAVVEAESGGNPSATSDKGAMGLMQLMPQTAHDMGLTDPYDPAQNLEGGSRYLRSMIDKFGDLPLAIAAYNAGPGAVTKAHGIPPYPETQHYVKHVLDLYREHLGQ